VRLTSKAPDPKEKSILSILKYVSESGEFATRSPRAAEIRIKIPLVDSFFRNSRNESILRRMTQSYLAH
jgi:hypothetical protein